MENYNALEESSEENDQRLNEVTFVNVKIYLILLFHILQSSQIFRQSSSNLLGYITTEQGRRNGEGGLR